LLAELGLFDEAVIQFQQALELEPLASNIGANLGHALMGTGQYEKGLAQLERVGVHLDIGLVNWAVFAQHFRWRRGNLRPGTEKNVSKSVQNPKGILLMIQEIHNPTESMRQQWGQSSADPFCVLSIMNSSKK